MDSPSGADIAVSLHGRHSELIAKLEAATGPDRGLDALVGVAVRFDVDRAVPDEEPGIIREITGLTYAARRYTNSLDAVFDAAGGRLPGWLRDVSERNPGWAGRDWLAHIESPGPSAKVFSAKGRTAPLAFAAALMKALGALSDDAEGRS